MLELYHHGTSVCAAKVRLALAEKGTSWVGRYVDILAGEQFNAEFLRLNPKALVPVLVHDGLVIQESTVINEYVDEVFDGPPLRPTSSGERAAMRLWTKRVDEALHPAVGPITFAISHRYAILEMTAERREAYLESTPDPVQRIRKRAWVEEGLDAAEVQHGLVSFSRALIDMEATLASRAWLAGSAYSLADIALTPYLVRLEMLGLWDIWGPVHPRVDAWLGRVKQRASFQPALFQYMPDALRATMLENGRKAAPQLRTLLSGVLESA